MYVLLVVLKQPKPMKIATPNLSFTTSEKCHETTLCSVVSNRGHELQGLRKERITSVLLRRVVQRKDPVSGVSPLDI